MAKTDLVVKSNRLVEASYRLGLVEQRIVLYAIVCARETGCGLNAIDFVSISARDYAEHFHSDEDSAYSQIKDAALSLYERGFELYDIDPDSGKPRTIKARWVSAASYIDGNGVIQLRFSPDIVPYITRLEKEFTRYNLEMVANMSSIYAVRMYELLIQWGSVGIREIEIAWLRQVLMVGDQYKLVKDFKRWVVDVALNQINTFSDINASYTQRKAGRTITHLLFTFSHKERKNGETKPFLSRKGVTNINKLRPTAKQTVATKETDAIGIAVDKNKVPMKEMVAAFLKGNERFAKRYPNLDPHTARCTPAVWAEFQGDFEEWLSN